MGITVVIVHLQLISENRNKSTYCPVPCQHYVDHLA